MLQWGGAVPEGGQLLGGLGGGGGLSGLSNIGNTLTEVTDGLSNLSSVTKSLSSVTSVASTLVETVMTTVTHLNAVTSQVTQVAGTLSKLTKTAASLPGTVVQFTNTITSALTTVTQVVSEASSVLGPVTELTEAITKVQTSTQVLVQQLTSSAVDATIVQKSVTNVMTSIKVFISVAQGYIGGASKLLNNSSILPMATAVGKILVSMQSVLEIVSSSITTVQTITKTTSTTTIIKTTLEKVRRLVQHFTNQISGQGFTPNLFQNLLGNIGGISSAPTQSSIVPGDSLPNQIVISSGGPATGTPIQPPNQGYPHSLNNNANGEYIPFGPGDGAPIQHSQGIYNGPDNVLNGHNYPSQITLNNQQLNSPPNTQYYPRQSTVDSDETPISIPIDNLPQHSFWNYPVRLAQPDIQVGPEYQPSNIGYQSPSQVNTIDGSYQPNGQIDIAPNDQADNIEAPFNENYQTYMTHPNNYPDQYSQSPESLQLQQPLQPSQQTFSNLATPENIGSENNYEFPNLSSENYPSNDQSSYPALDNSGISYPVPSSLSESYPNYPINAPSLPSISTSGPEYIRPISGNYLFPTQTPENYPSIGQQSYPVPESSGINYPINYPNYPINAPSLPTTATYIPVYTSPSYPESSAITPLALATASASASPGHATASASAAAITSTPPFSGPRTSISIFRQYEIALGDIFAKILQIISSLQGVPTDQLTFAVRQIYATTHSLMLFVSQLNDSSATSPTNVDIIFNIINELSENLQDLVRLTQQIFAVQGTSAPLLSIIKLTSAVTALTINQVQILAQEIDTSAINFVIQSTIDRVLLYLINVYGQLYPSSYNGQIDQPNGVDNLFNNLSASNQSYKPIYHGVSHSVIRVIKNIIQQSAQTIQNSDNDYNRLLNILQALPLNQDQVNQITNLMSQMYNSLNTVSYRLESIDQILNYMSDYGHVGNFAQYSTVSRSSSSASASSTSSSDGTDTSAASAASSSSTSTTINAPYSEVVRFAGPFAQNLLKYSGSPVLSP